MSADERTLGERVDEMIAFLEPFAEAGAPTAVRHVALLREQQSMIDALVSNYELRNEMARVTSERDSLRRALDAVNAAHDRLLTEHIAVTDERNQLRRDLEAARDYIEALDMQNHRLRCDAETDLRDADRYRWLRGDLCEDHSHRWTQWEVRCWKAPMWTDDLRREDLDAAIDLARAGRTNRTRNALSGP